MLRGLAGYGGNHLGELLRARPEFASLVTDELHDWLPAALADPQSQLSRYLSDNGFVPAFRILHMCYSGSSFTVPPLPFCPYYDDDYVAVQDLVSRSFYELRRSVGIEPYYIAPSAETRDEYARHADDCFVLRQNGRIIGFITAIGDELDDLCVDEEHRGQGLGAALLMHGANHIFNKGHDCARLCVLDKNTGAYALYRKLGFTDHFATYLYREHET